MSYGPFTKLEIKLQCKGGASPPAYQSHGASGADVRALLKETVILAPGKRALIPTGLSVEIPPGFEIQVRPRSGLALKEGLAILNSPGTIDADYRGEIKIVLFNAGQNPIFIEPQMRIAQLVLAPVLHMTFITSALDTSARGKGGFGQTGLK